MQSLFAEIRDRQVLKREFIAGLTTFLTMSYIVVVNPTILSNHGQGVPFTGALTATVILCFICSVMMGVYARLPYGVAPGMGVNAFFTYTLIVQQQIPWPTALAMVFWSGVIFFILSVLPVRTAILQAMPPTLRKAAAVGIGLFLAFIGLKNAGIVESHPITLVTFGPFGINQWLAIGGLLLIAVFTHKKNPLAFLIGILAVTVVAWILGRVHLPQQIFSAPDFKSTFFALNFWGALKLAYLPAIFSIMFTDLFDSISTFMGLSHSAELIDQNGDPIRMREGLIVDSYATALAGLFGTSSGTAYIESAAGIEAGGRTGWTAIFAGLLFLPCLFIGPLVQVIPDIATAPVLIVVGYLMFTSIRDLHGASIEETLPAFFTAILIPLTFSITQGLMWGIILHVLLHVLVGKKHSVPKTLYIIAAICAVLLYLH